MHATSTARVQPIDDDDLGGVARIGIADQRADVHLLRSFQRGEESGVRGVYERYSGMVHSVAYQVLRRPALAEEAVQQAFLQAWRASATLDVQREIAPWLVTITRRVAIDIARREGRRPTTSLDTADAGERSLIYLPPSETVAWETAQIRLAIESLPPDDRAIVRLQHLDGFTHVEIAEHLGVPLGTVKSRSYRAHRSLAAKLAHLRDPN